MMKLMSMLCALSACLPLLGEVKPELSVSSCHWVKLPAEGWQTRVPSAAQKADFKFGNLLDLDRLSGTPGKSSDEGALLITFQSSAEGNVFFGIGADWWCEVWINGECCFSTMAFGNGVNGFSPLNNPFFLPVRKGNNFLAVKVRRGRDGWKVVCGPGAEKFKLYDGPIPWQQGKLPKNSGRSGESYRLIVLGDMHFDTDPQIYHAKYHEPDARLNRIQRAEFARNAAMWKTRCPQLLRAAATLVTPQTKAVIQVGDLIQGDCGDPKVHAQMLLDTLQMLQKEFHNLPVLTVTGNHDVRGPGAVKAYAEVMPSYHARVLKEPVAKTTFYTKMGGDLFLFIDFNDPDLEVIYEAMDVPARYRFVISHGPVLPSDCNSFKWYLFGHHNAWRRTLHQLFMRHDVIVLTGHIHDLEVTECVTNEGRITQLMANSVWCEDGLARFRTRCSRPEEYGKNQTDPEGKALFAEYRNVITRYWKADGAGFVVIDVSPDSVTANFYGGASAVPAKKIAVRDSLANPVLKKLADPFLFYAQKEWFCSGTEGRGNRLTLRHAPTLAGLKEAAPLVIYESEPKSECRTQFWAPEFHHFNAHWYCYFTACNGDFNRHKMWVLKSQDDTLTGKWELFGPLTTDADGWSIDGTPFEFNGKRYFIWAKVEEGHEVLAIAPMESPVRLGKARSVIARPEAGEGGINEGPFQLRTAGGNFLLYSVNPCQSDNYAVKALELTGRDPMDPAAWRRLPHPVLTKSDTVFGPGHCMISAGPDGKLLLVFHAYTDPESVRRNKASLRHTWVQELRLDDRARPAQQQPQR